MKTLKKKIVKYLMKDYSEDEAIKQVCFANIEKSNLIKITYDNGVVEYVEEKENML